MTNVAECRKHRETVISDLELTEMLEKASQIEDEFQRLRATAIVSLFRISGKRAGELARLKIPDLKLNKPQALLEVTFTLEKKTKYTLNKYLERHPAEENKTYRELHIDWMQWKKTEAEAVNLISARRAKSFPLSDPLTLNVIKYAIFVLKNVQPNDWLFPRCQNMFSSELTVDGSHGIKARQILNVIRGLSDAVWPHLFRETKAADIVRQDGSLYGAVKVQKALDLESVDTAMLYTNRYMTEVLTRTTDKPETQAPSQPISTALMGVDGKSLALSEALG